MRELFTEWLKSLNWQMKLKNRKIALFINNWMVHNDMPTLGFVKVIFLPPNTTSKLQLLDQGIIQNFYGAVRKRLFGSSINAWRRALNSSIFLLSGI